MLIRKEIVALALSAVIVVATILSPLLKHIVEIIPPADWTAEKAGRGELFVLIASAVSLWLLVLASLLLGFLALGRFVWALLAGPREGLDWWSMSGFAWLLMAIVLLPAYLLLARYSHLLPGGPIAPKTLDAVLSVLLLIWLESLLLLPVVIPVLEAHAKGIYDAGVYLNCLIGLIALPFAAVMAFGFFGAVVSMSAGDHNSLLDYFTVDVHTPHCADYLRAQLGLSAIPSSGVFDRPIVSAAARLTLFWVDSEINTVLLDAPNSVGCGLTQLRPIPDQWPLAVSVLFFKIFTSIVAVGAIALPIRSRAARKVSRASA